MAAGVRTGARVCKAVAVAALAQACGSPARPGPAAQPSPSLLPQEQTLELDEVEVRGLAFRPEALGVPPMIAKVTRRNANLAVQRRKVARKNPHPEDVALLVSLLWNRAEKLAAANPTQARALHQEGRDALRALREARGEKIDLASLERLAIAELWLGDETAAVLAYEELVRRLADQPDARRFQIRLALLYLGRHRIADAAVLSKGWSLADLEPAGAYVAGWIAFAMGDAAAARTAIARAAQGWPEDPSRRVVRRDLVLILARTGATVSEAIRILDEVIEDPARRYRQSLRLSLGYEKAGRYALASAALEAIERLLSGDQLPPDDRIGFRYRQADYAFRRDDPATAAEHAIAAHKALASCGGRCSEQTEQAVAERVLKLAQFSHTVFARSFDRRHLEAARALYRYYLAIPARPDTQAVQDHLRTLEETEASADPETGVHDAEVMLNLLLARREALADCYERALLAEPSLEGGAGLSIEIDPTGRVVDAQSQPSGTEGLAQVATCASERARTWTFPSRTVPGKTILRVPLNFRRQDAVEPAAPPAAADQT